MNAVNITGNVVADPERVDYAEGKALANLRIANNEFVNGESVANGFFDITVFGTMATNVLTSVKKGDRLVVAARLQHSVFEGQDGKNHGRTKLIANAIGASLEFTPVTGVTRKATTTPSVVEAPEAVS